MPEVYKHEKFKTRWPGRAYLLYLLAIPLVPALLITLALGDLKRLLIYGGALTTFMIGARLMKRGLKDEAEFHRRKIAAAAKLPRKTLGALLTGAGTFICSWLAIGHSLPFAAVVGALAVAGCFMFYGTDPRGIKGSATGSHGYSSDEIIATLTEAENKIRSIESSVRNIRNPELVRRLKRISDRARKIVSAMEEDPADIRRARRFLNVYLDGARSVTEGFARTHRKKQDNELESNFRNVLTTIEGVFEQQHQKLLEHDKLDLDVQIDVLSQQLKKEGVI